MSALKQFSRREVNERSDLDNSTVLIIHNLVYDVTPFLDDHPGGHEVLQRLAGQDATEDFDDISHSLDAKELMKKYLIGEVELVDRRAEEPRVHKWEDVKSSDGNWLSSWQAPLLLAVVVSLILLYFV